MIEESRVDAMNQELKKRTLEAFQTTYQNQHEKSADKSAHSTYPGGKAQEGVYQKIINQIPPHRVYIEPFAGGGAVLLRKRPAEISLVCDLAADALTALKKNHIAGQVIFERMDALQCLAGIEQIPMLCLKTPGQKQKFNLRIWILGNESIPAEDVFIYLDPPYLMETRSSKRRIYKHESTRELHERLLDVIDRLPCNIAISGYGSTLYAEKLKAPKWRSIHYNTVTRGGTKRIEYLWMNYPEPSRLHDASYVGDDYRKRQDFKRKRERWRRRLAAMTPVERSALLEALFGLEG